MDSKVYDKKEKQYHSGPWLITKKRESPKHHALVVDLQHQLRKDLTLKELYIQGKPSPGSHKLCDLGYWYYVHDTQQRVHWLLPISRKHIDLRLDDIDRIRLCSGDVLFDYVDNSGALLQKYADKRDLLHISLLAPDSERNLDCDMSAIDLYPSTPTSTPNSAESESGTADHKRQKTKDWIDSLKRDTPYGICPFYWNMGNCKKQNNCLLIHGLYRWSVDNTTFGTVASSTTDMPPPPPRKPPPRSFFVMNPNKKG